MLVKTHQTEFQKNTRTGLFKAACTCGWMRLGENLTELQKLAATHDIEWHPITPDGEFAHA